MTMSCDDAGTKPVRRLEVFTGAGHRREWSDDARAAIIAESYSGAESVSAVARRHALAPSQLFTWRRELRRAAQAAGIGAVASEPEPFFVPAVIDTEHAGYAWPDARCSQAAHPAGAGGGSGRA